MEKHYINWQNGMKISATHFEKLEDAFRAEIVAGRAAGLTHFNYGLLPSSDASSSPFDLYFKLDQSDEMVLNLISCQAIMPGGAYVSIRPRDQYLSEYRIPLDSVRAKLQTSKDQEIYIVLHLSLFQREPIGEPESVESPIRQPFTTSKLQLRLQFLDEVTYQNQAGNFQLIVGRVFYADDTPRIDENYIPPCTMVAAHPKLELIVDSWHRALNGKLLNNAQKTIRNIEQRGILSSHSPVDKLGQLVAPGAAAYDLSTVLLGCIARQFPRFQQRKEQSFIYTFKDLQEIGAALWSCLQSMSYDKRERLENYLQEAFKIKENITETLWQFINYSYRHERIDQSVSYGHSFLNVLLKLYDATDGFPTRDFDWKKIETDRLIFDEKKDERTTT